LNARATTRYIGAGAIIVTKGDNLVAIALAHGLAIGLMIAASGHISGGVYNPSLTVGLMAARKLPYVRGVIYIVVQLLGGIVAALILKWIFPADLVSATKLGATVPGAGISAGQARFTELILTFFLMFVVFGAAVDKRGPATIAGLAIGLTITMDIFAGGPIVGAVIAALVYTYFLLDESAQDETVDLPQE
jgi:aquaporin TIP